MSVRVSNDGSERGDSVKKKKRISLLWGRNWQRQGKLMALKEDDQTKGQVEGSIEMWPEVVVGPPSHGSRRR